MEPLNWTCLDRYIRLGLDKYGYLLRRYFKCYQRRWFHTDHEIYRHDLWVYSCWDRRYGHNILALSWQLVRHHFPYIKRLGRNSHAVSSLYNRHKYRKAVHKSLSRLHQYYYAEDRKSLPNDLIHNSKHVKESRLVVPTRSSWDGRSGNFPVWGTHGQCKCNLWRQCRARWLLSLWKTIALHHD